MYPPYDQPCTAILARIDERLALEPFDPRELVLDFGVADRAIDAALELMPRRLVPRLSMVNTIQPWSTSARGASKVRTRRWSPLAVRPAVDEQ